MAIYFVDYENVGSTGIEGVDKLDAGNVVHIFYSMKADTMKIGQVIQLMNVNAGVEFHDVTMRGQKNALDFQLIAMLYFTKQESETCYIISKDTGYDAAISFGKKIGAQNVFRKATILDAYHSERHSAGKREKPHTEEIVPPEKEVLGDSQEAERMAMQAIEQAASMFEAAPFEEAPAEAAMLETAAQSPDMDAEAQAVQIPGGSDAFLSAANQLSILERSFGGLFDYGLADDMDFDNDESILPFPMNEPDQEPVQEKKEPEKEEPQKAEEAETAAPDPAQERPLSVQEDGGQASLEEESGQSGQQQEAGTAEAGTAEAGTEETHSSRRRNRRSSSSRGRKRQNGHAESQTADGQPEKQTPSGAETAKAEEERPAYVRNHAFESKVAQVMSAGGFSLSDEDIALIGEALKTTKNKNQFYQFFRKRKGEAAGREFYLEIRGQYEGLKVLKNEAPNS